MKTAILLSIHPEYAEKIISGAKRYEYRKKLPKNPVSRIVIYETSPVMLCTAISEVEEELNDTPENLWNLTKEYAGISREAFFKYFEGRETAYAYRLGTVQRIENRRLPFKAPQSFKYLTDDEIDRLLDCGN